MNTRESGVDQHAFTKITPDEQAGERKLILIVDDEPVMQELGRDILEEQGYRVLVASDGLEALDMYRRYGDEIDLVVLDMLMPRMDGGQTYIEMKKMNVDVKAFFCTGYTPSEVIGPLLASESLRALQKPFRPSEFVSIVRDVLSS